MSEHLPLPPFVSPALVPTVDDRHRSEEAADAPVPPGYETLGVLGKGGMGVVYRARQVKADRLVALKMIRAAEPDPVRLQRALWVHDAGPWIAGVCAALLVILTLWTWKRVGGRVGRWFFRVAMVLICGVAVAGAYYTHVNFYEMMMFHPYGALAYESPSESKAEPKDMVLAVKLGGHARAYPILTMGYHHVVNGDESPPGAVQKLARRVDPMRLGSNVLSRKQPAVAAVPGTGAMAVVGWTVEAAVKPAAGRVIGTISKVELGG